MIVETIAGGTVLMSAFGLGFTWRQRRNLRRIALALRAEMTQGQEALAQQITLIDHKMMGVMESQRGMQASAELLRDGRLGLPVRTRALKMLRSGVGADTAAAELGLPKNEVRLLAKVAAELSSRN